MVLTDKQLMLDSKSFRQQLKYSAYQDKSEGDSGKSQTIRVALVYSATDTFDTLTKEPNIKVGVA